MQEKIKDIGDTLRQRRKELNLSLKEVENSTSIRITHLQAIEEGEVTRLISPVYAQGFLKQYANFLGIDGDRIIRDNPDVFSRGPNQEFSYGIGTLEVRGNPSARVKWVPNAFWLGGFVAVLAIAWYIARLLEVI